MPCCIQRTFLHVVMPTIKNGLRALRICLGYLRVSDGTAADGVHRYGLQMNRDVKEFGLCIADIWRRQNYSLCLCKKQCISSDKCLVASY